MAREQSVLVLTYWSFNDALVQTYTLPYVRMIAAQLGPKGRVYLVTLDHGEETVLEKFNDERIIHLGYRYRRFGLKAVGMIFQLLRSLLLLIRRENISMIHAWCTPAGAIGYILSRLSGVSLVIDSYEPHAEAMVENGTWKRSSNAFRMLWKLEKLQTHHADHLIAASAGMKDYASRKYDFHGNMFVKPAGVDLDRFSFDQKKDPILLREFGFDDKIVITYAGKFGGIYLEQEVFDLLKVAHEHWGDQLRILLLTSHQMNDLAPFIKNAGLSEDLFTLRFVPHNEMPRYLGLADIAITPVRPVPTKRYCTPIKNGEYWALGLPVIITPNISDDSEIIRINNAGAVLEGFDRRAYEKAIRDIEKLLKSEPVEKLQQRIRAMARHYRNFEKAEAIYKAIYGTKG